MDDNQLIIYILASIPLIIILIFSLLLKGKKRVLSFIMASAYLIICILFFSLRPTYIDYQIEYRVEILDEYLKEKYPTESWVFWTVPHREKGYSSSNPYIIEVIFDNEPNVHYAFYVSKDTIKIAGFSGGDNPNPIKLGDFWFL